MKAVVCTRYGGPEVLEVTDVPKPVPRDNEVLVKVRATTVTSADFRVRSMQVPHGFGFLSRLALGMSGPRQRILGTELAGDVEAVGKNVRTFGVGDAVFAFGGARMGCYAEYRCFPEDGLLATKPPNLTYEEAAALSFGGTTALDFFRRGKLQRGEHVLINGASGGVGTAAIQMARQQGAQVTAVCSAANRDLVLTLGAHHVLDYQKEDFTQNGVRYDVIMDAVGTAPFSRCAGSLKDGGRFLAVLATLGQMLQAPLVSWTGSKRVVAGPSSERAEDIRHLAELAAAGAFRPFIEARYPLEDMVAAHRHVDTGRKRGNVVVTVGHG